MSLVVDASVAIKWFVAEELHAEARQLLIGGEELHAPDLLLSELANAAWKKAMRKEIGHRQAGKIAVACLGGVPTLHASAGLVGRASEIALSIGHPVYDCLYIACAEALNASLVSADARLAQVVGGTQFAPLVRRLDRPPP